MKPRSNEGSKKVDAYLAEVPPKMRPALRRLRETIRRAAPGAEEAISYRMPAFRQDGALVYYAAFKDHISLFPGSVETQQRFARELGSFAVAKGTIHFTPDRPLPSSLVTRIVKARVAENARRKKTR